MFPINDIEIINTGIDRRIEEYIKEERVICQRERNVAIQLIVC